MGAKQHPPPGPARQSPPQQRDHQQLRQLYRHRHRRHGGQVLLALVQPQPQGIEAHLGSQVGRELAQPNWNEGLQTGWRP